VPSLRIWYSESIRSCRTSARFVSYPMPQTDLGHNQPHTKVLWRIHRLNYLSYQGSPTRAEKADVKTRGAIAPLTHTFHGIFHNYVISAAICCYYYYYTSRSAFWLCVLHPAGANRNKIIFKMGFYNHNWCQWYGEIFSLRWNIQLYCEIISVYIKPIPTACRYADWAIQTSLQPT
jgi:hypothetical protein